MSAADLRCSGVHAAAVLAESGARKEAEFKATIAADSRAVGQMEARAAAVIKSYDPTQFRCSELVTAWAVRRASKPGDVPKPGDEELLLMTLGTAGTGKSHVIKGTAMRCRLLFKSFKSVRTMAPTGVAAANLGDGSCTLDSIFLTQHEEDLDDEKLDRLCEELSELRLLIIDEQSMLGAAAFYIIHRRLLQLVKRRMRRMRMSQQEVQAFDKPFGGIGVWLVGDFGQLQPVKATSLLAGSRIVEPAETGKRSKAMLGIQLFNKFQSVVRLRRVHRQAEVDDYKPSTLRLRDAAILPSDVELWKTHDLEEVPAEWHGADGLEQDALTLVAENGLCGEINGQRLRAFLDEEKKNVAGGADVVVRCDAWHNFPETASRRKAEEFRQLRSTLFAHVGAPVMLLLNKLYDVSVVPMGLLNGARGHIVAILYEGVDVLRADVDWVKCGTPVQMKNPLPFEIIVNFPGYVKACNA